MFRACQAALSLVVVILVMRMLVTTHPVIADGGFDDWTGMADIDVDLFSLLQAIDLPCTTEPTIDNPFTGEDSTPPFTALLLSSYLHQTHHDTFVTLFRPVYRCWHERSVF